MRQKPPDCDPSSWKLQTRCTVGPESLNDIQCILRSHGKRNPLWILPSEPNHRKTIKKLLRPILQEKTACMVGIEELASTIASSCAGHTEPFDCVIACGGSACIDQAKLFVGQVRGTSDAGTFRELFTASPSLIIVPFGLLDGLECQGRIRQRTVLTVVPVHAVLDGRLSGLTTSKAVGRTMVRCLQELCTSLLMSKDPLLRSMALSAFSYAASSLERITGTSGDVQRWREGTLFAGAVLHGAGACAQNRGASAVMEFSDNLAVAGTADYYQSAAAFLPPLMHQIAKTESDLFEDIRTRVKGGDPFGFVASWIQLADVNKTDRLLDILVAERSTWATDPIRAPQLEPVVRIHDGAEA